MDWRSPMNVTPDEIQWVEGTGDLEGQLIEVIDEPAIWSARLKKGGPIRLLCQTNTDLVPGKGWSERLNFILDRMCIEHWGCTFIQPEHRWYGRHVFFGLKDCECYFVVDYGESANDDEVPIKSYKWDGESLKLMPELAQNPKIRSKLKKRYPFTRPPRSTEPREPISERDDIIARIISERRLFEDHFEYLEQNPDDVKWLKARLPPHLWHTLETPKEPLKRNPEEP